MFGDISGMKISLKKYFSSLSLIAIAGLSYGCGIMPSNASTVNTSYSESFDNFPNPERGFYISDGPDASDSNFFRKTTRSKKPKYEFGSSDFTYSQSIGIVLCLNPF